MMENKNKQKLLLCYGKKYDENFIFYNKYCCACLIAYYVTESSMNNILFYNLNIIRLASSPLRTSSLPPVTLNRDLFSSHSTSDCISSSRT